MTIGIADALQSLRPGAEWVLRGNEYAGLEWLDQAQQKPTENEVQDAITMLTLQQPYKDCKHAAMALIAETDWAVLPDVGLINSADFVTYRATLRGFIINPVVDPMFPTRPDPIWS